MALVKCPDCGREVSSSAKACPQCGCPISELRTDGPVRIKLTSQLAGTVRILNMENDDLLWSGKPGSVASFSVSAPTHIGLKWGIAGNVAKENIFTVEANRKYEFVWQKGFFMNKLNLLEIDVIDSSF